MRMGSPPSCLPPARPTNQGVGRLARWRSCGSGRLRVLADGSREVRVDEARPSRRCRDLERAHPRSTAGCSTTGAGSASTSPCSWAASACAATPRSPRPTGSRSSARSPAAPRRRGSSSGRGRGCSCSADPATASWTSSLGRSPARPSSTRCAIRTAAFASVTSGQFGPRVHVADDPTGEWEPTDGPRFPETEDASVDRTWVIVPGEGRLLYAGVAPAALFESRDGGMSWELNRGMWDQPTRKEWRPGAGGWRCTRSPRGRATLAARDRDLGGRGVAERGRRPTWTNGNAGLVPATCRRSARGRDRSVRPQHVPGAAPARRLFMQFHGGVYRSDDAGASWISIADRPALGLRVPDESTRAIPRRRT